MKKTAIALAAAMALAGCGGGSTSGGSNRAASGFYVGSGVLTASSPLGTIREPFTTNLRVETNGNVTVDYGTPLPIFGSMSGNTFTARASAGWINTVCSMGGYSGGSGTFQVTGSINGSSATEAVTGAMFCNGGQYTVNFTGYANLTKTESYAAAPSVNGLSAIVSSTLTE